MSKKWYNYIVSVDDAAAAEQSPGNSRNAPTAAKSAAQSVAEISDIGASTVNRSGSTGPG